MPLQHEKCRPKEIKNFTQLQVLIPTLDTVKRPLSFFLAELQFLEEFLCVHSSALVGTSGSVPCLYLLSRNVNTAETLLLLAARSLQISQGEMITVFLLSLHCACMFCGRKKLFFAGELKNRE